MPSKKDYSTANLTIKEFHSLSPREKMIWRSGQGYYVRGFKEESCHSELSKNGYRYAKKVYKAD